MAKRSLRARDKSKDPAPTVAVPFDDAGVAIEAAPIEPKVVDEASEPKPEYYSYGARAGGPIFMTGRGGHGCMGAR